MQSTAEYLSLLAAGGHMREFMRQAPGGGSWVDEFCDGLIHRLSLQQELERCGKYKINTWLTQVPQWQVNVKPPKEDGWSVSVTGDLLADLVTALKKAEARN